MNYFPFFLFIPFFSCVFSTQLSEYIEIPTGKGKTITKTPLTTGITVKHILFTNSTPDSNINFYILKEEDFLLYNSTQMVVPPSFYKEIFKGNLENVVIPKSGTYLKKYYFLVYNFGSLPLNSSIIVFVSIRMMITSKHWVYSLFWVGFGVAIVTCLFVIVSLTWVVIHVLFSRYKKRKYPSLYDIKFLKDKDVRISRESRLKFFFTELTSLFVKALIIGFICPFLGVYLLFVYFLKNGLLKNEPIGFMWCLPKKMKTSRVSKSIYTITDINLEEWYKIQDIKMKMLEKEKSKGSSIEKTVGSIKSKQPIYYTPIPQTIFQFLVTLSTICILFPLWILIFVVSLVSYSNLDYYSLSEEYIVGLVCLLIISAVGIIGIMITIFVLPIFIIVEVCTGKRILFPFRISSHALRRSIFMNKKIPSVSGLFENSILSNNIEALKLLLYLGYKPTLDNVRVCEDNYTSPEIYIFVFGTYEYFKFRDSLRISTSSAQNFLYNKSEEKKMKEIPSNSLTVHLLSNEANPEMENFDLEGINEIIS